MQPKFNIVIADTSCFILLDKIKQLSILNEVFGQITTTREIANEFGKPLPEWVFIKGAVNRDYQNTLAAEVDGGEAISIALAMEIDHALLIVDDFKARKLAAKLGIEFTGTMGVFLKAKDLGVIPSIKSILIDVQKTNFRFTKEVISLILKEADED
jgi:predicted nucleic acid-binding protein